MGKNSNKPPPAPDPVATAQAQAGVNRDAAITQANLNRINQVTPQGTISYSQTGTNADGTPQYTQTQTYSPGEQAVYEQNNRIAQALGGLGEQNISRVAATQGRDFNFNGMQSVGPIGDAGQIQKSLDYSGLTKLPGTEDFGAEGQRMADSVYGQIAARLNPRYAQAENDNRARLAAQGISEDSAAYRRTSDNFARDRTDAYQQAAFQAQQAGADEQSRLFGLAMNARQQGQNEVNTQGQFANTAQNQQFNQNAARAAQEAQLRQQQIQEATYLRNLPLNDIAALLGTGGGVNDPTFQPVAQVGVAAPDYAGMVQNNYNNQMQQYNQKQANRSAGLGSIFGAAGTIGAAMLSDVRFKENVKRIGTLANGVATYTFNYIGQKAMQFGVMAQEVLGIAPDAVVEGVDGTLYVDYGKVY